MATEKRLIDANALIAYFKEQCEIASKDGEIESLYTLAALTCCIDYFEQIPTVDAVEVVRGHWRKYSDDKFMGYGADGRIKYRKVYTYECSKCGRNVAIKSNYCPNCGADMKERKDNG